MLVANTTYLTGIPQPYTRRDAEEFVANAVVTPWETVPIFAIVLDNKAIGTIQLIVEPAHERAEIGYSMSSHHWGKGLGPEAARAVVDYAFTYCRLKKVYAMIHPNNERSWRLAERVGMVREGSLRSHTVERGERWDMLYYGLLLDEWRV